MKKPGVLSFGAALPTSLVLVDLLWIPQRQQTVQLVNSLKKWTFVELGGVRPDRSDPLRTGLNYNSHPLHPTGMPPRINWQCVSKEVEKGFFNLLV